jgi:hypothetical protein
VAIWAVVQGRESEKHLASEGELERVVQEQYGGGLNNFAMMRIGLWPVGGPERRGVGVGHNTIANFGPFIIDSQSCGMDWAKYALSLSTCHF